VHRSGYGYILPPDEAFNCIMATFDDWYRQRRSKTPLPQKRAGEGRFCVVENAWTEGQAPIKGFGLLTCQKAKGLLWTYLNALLREKENEDILRLC
jgi:hypothetical protein